MACAVKGCDFLGDLGPGECTHEAEPGEADAVGSIAGYLLDRFTVAQKVVGGEVDPARLSAADEVEANRILEDMTRRKRFEPGGGSAAKVDPGRRVRLDRCVVGRAQIREGRGQRRLGRLEPR